MSQGEASHVHSEGPSSVSQLDLSGNGGVGGGSTVESDRHSTASSVDHSYDGAPTPDPSPAESSTVTTASRVSTAGSVSPPTADMAPAAHNAYRGGLYGSDRRARDQTSSTLGRASDFQTAEGLVEDLPTHSVEQEPPSGGDSRDLDITGQSYVQEARQETASVATSSDL